ncbi:MAG: peptide chain release factor N(5)-glutamine methyltransferase [Hasllibacter sp.]
MTFDAARRAALARLLGHAPDPSADVRHLLAHAAGVPRDRLIALGPEPLPEGAAARLEALVEGRLAGRSVAALTGRKSFWGREFEVTEDMLAPRPETEILVAEALEGRIGTVLDLGTGTGCIAVSLLAERPGARGVAVDLSGAALAVAARNAERHGVADRLDLRRGDWWAPVAGRFDLIVSNPPYLAEAEMAALSPEVAAEPRLALTPGGDGLGAYRAIAAGLGRHLAPGGRVLLEIGPAQGAAVAEMLAGLEGVRVLPDLDGRDRVVAGRAPA